MAIRISRRALLLGTAFGLGAKGATAGQKASPPSPVTIAIPENYPSGAIVHHLQSGDAVAYSESPIPGLRIDAGSGDIILSDRDAFFRAAGAQGLAFEITMTRRNGRQETVAIRAGKMADHLDLARYRQNMTFWIDAADNAHVSVIDGRIVEEVRDKAVPARHARNDLYADGRPLRQARPGDDRAHPALRFAPPSDKAVYGLFFPDAPLYAGIQRLYLNPGGKIAIRQDNRYKANLPWQGRVALKDFPAADLPPLAFQPMIMTIRTRKSGQIEWYVNGREIGRERGWRFDHDSVTFVVFAPEPESLEKPAQIWSSAALGQSYIWKGAAYEGYLYEVVSLVEAETQEE